MLKSYFLVAWRNLKRNKAFSFINIAGLAIGMASAILILLWIQYEVNYDQFFNNKDRIYEVWNRYNQDGELQSWKNTPKVMAQAIQRDYPEVERTTRVNYSFPLLFSAGDKKVEVRGTMVDSSFLQVFSFPLLQGRGDQVLQDMYSVVITESMAKQLFGNEDPMGKILKVDNRESFTVTGVLKDLPTNTRFDFKFLLPWSYLRHIGEDDTYWSNNSTATYVLLKPNATLASIEPKLSTIRKRYDKSDPNMETFLYPFTRFYLHGNFEGPKETGGRIEIVQLFAIIASLILLIACINFMNLSTARSEKRAKEVGIRKVVGARKYALVMQFLSESVLLAFIAGIFSLFIVQLALPAFNKLVDRQLFVDFTQVWFWVAAIGFVLFTGILAGSYPAIFLSSFRPVKVIKGTFKAAHAAVSPRKILVVTQFTIAIVLIISTIIIRLQIKKGQDRHNGYDRSNLVYHYMEGDVAKNYPLIKNELLSQGIALSVSKTLSPITEIWANSWSIGWKGKGSKDRTVINRFSADDAIAKTAGLTLVQGRDLDLTNYPTDSLACLLNESAVKAMGFKEPLGQIVEDMGREWHVVGVVKDFIVNSPYRPVEPIMIAGAQAFFNVIHFKLNSANSLTDNIAGLQKVFKKYNPDYTFNYRFIDEAYERKFNSEKRSGKLATLFAVLTIIISCLGLFGLASYMAENRIKEIGVRKVLGASVMNITRLLSTDFLKLVIIAFVIAVPLGFWAMHAWLQSFPGPYRANMQWWVFALAGGLAVFISIATVSYQALRAAMSNPVKSLRSE
jgi:putative ABC transport system permease protein